MYRIVSKLDSSINFIKKYDKSMVEARYVRRNKNYISAYLSSHNGCIMNCKFCWLTQTKQTEFKHVDNNLYKEQLDNILDYATTIDNQNDRSNIRININLMSRGEPLGNKFILNKYNDFYNSLQTSVYNHGYDKMKINLSTIMPVGLKDKKLFDIFNQTPVNIYYSIYSINNEFKKKWIPKAMDTLLALEKLKEFQDLTGQVITFHFALINGENDDINDIQRLASTIDKFQFNRTKLNIVRFNPHPNLKYIEPNIEKINDIFNILNSVMKDNTISTNKSRIVPRIGSDVYASCGMFIDNNDL